MIENQNPKIQMMQISEIDIDEENRLRPVSEVGVESMIASIEELGIIKDAIHVRKKRRASGETLVLIAGGHRLEAAKRLGWEAIPTRVWADITDDDARFMEIDDNLAGKFLDALDQAEFLAARKRVYENAHPETRKGIAGAKARWDATTNLAVASFVKATAEATGLSERNIQRRAMVGERLSRADIRMIREASTRIKATDLEALAKIGEPIVRSDVIGRLASGEVKSVSEALEKIQPQKAKVSDLDGKALQTLATAWTRAPMKVKRQFVSDESAALFGLLNDLDGEL